jgi:hypothetical protein
LSQPRGSPQCHVETLSTPVFAEWRRASARIAVAICPNLRRFIRYRQPEVQVIQQIERLAADMKNQMFAQIQTPG